MIRMHSKNSINQLQREVNATPTVAITTKPIALKGTMGTYTENTSVKGIAAATGVNRG